MEEKDGFEKIWGTIKIDTYDGTLKFNLLELLNQLDEDKKKELLSDGGYWNLITKEMAEDITDKFSRENYQEEYTKLRQIILNSESMPKVIREWAIAMIESREKAKEEEQYWSNAYWALYRWARDDYKKEKMMPRLPDRKYGKKYSEEFMAKVEEKILEWKKEFPDLAVDYEDIEGTKVMNDILDHLNKL
jgi:hypothetical protein